MSTTETQAKTVLEQTKDLLDAARRGDAVAFQKLVDERDSLINALSETTVATGDQEQVFALLQEALALNTHLTAQFLRDKEQLVEQRKALTKSAQMRSAYSQVK